MVTNFVSGLNLVRLNLWNILLSNVLNREYLHLQIRLLDSKLIEWKEEKKTFWTWEFGLFFSAARSLKVIFLFSSSFWSTENKSWKTGLLKNAVIWRKPWKQFKPKCHFLPVSTHLNSLSLSRCSHYFCSNSLSLLQSLCQHINTLTKTISISASPYLGMFLKKSFYIVSLSLSVTVTHYNNINRFFAFVSNI